MTDTEGKEIRGKAAASLMEGGTDLEITVQVEIARVDMRVDQVLGLVPGRVLRLGKPVGSDVTLRSGKNVIARGELLDHEGQLAVEITEVP